MSLEQPGKLSSSHIFTDIVKMNQIAPKIQAMVKPENIINNKITQSFQGMSMTSGYALLSKVLRMWENKEVNLYHSDNVSTTVPALLPMVLRQNASVSEFPIVDIFIKPYVKSDPKQPEQYNVSIPILYTLLESGLFFRSLYANPKRILNVQSLEETMMNFYVQMVYNILLRDYAISVDQTVSDSVKYLLRKFFTKFIWQSSHLRDEALCKGLFLQEFDVVNLNSLFEGVHNISELANVFSTSFVQLSGVSIIYLIDKITNTYSSPSLLALDFLPSIFMMISSALNRSYLISQKPAESILKQIPNINRFYSEIIRSGI